ncbi:hypothetical protein LINPERPRIM_LOCUS33482, partial [Linum perenne]
LCNSPIVSEAKALYEATKLAILAPIRASIRSDCKELVTAINGPKHRWPWQCFGYLGGITNLLHDRQDISISFTPRAHNLDADRISKMARLGTLRRDWVFSMYPEL